MQRGTVVEGVAVRPLRVTLEGAERGMGILLIDVAEGKKREIRVLTKDAGLAVERLVRTHFGPIHLATQRSGTLRQLNRHEIEALRRAAKGAARG
jgi:16S rRNA U516 pseudouridylate synthase RsuA-like enzyme